MTTRLSMRLFALVSTHTDSGAAILPRHYWRLLRVCVASVPPYRCVSTEVRVAHS